MRVLQYSGILFFSEFRYSDLGVLRNQVDDMSSTLFGNVIFCATYDKFKC